MLFSDRKKGFFGSVTCILFGVEANITGSPTKFGKLRVVGIGH